MAEISRAQRMEQVIRAYFQACKDADAKGIAACFCPDAVHYFPHREVWVGADTIGNGAGKLIQGQGGYWTVDQLLIDAERHAAVVEWSRFYRQHDRISRGMEWYVFDPETLRIREVRLYFAAVPNPTVMQHELVSFDYAGRGYPTLS